MGLRPTGLTTLPYTTHPVRTERLLLRPLTEADADDVYAYQSIAEVLRYIPWPSRTREESREHTLKRAGFTRLEKDGDGVVLAAELVGPDGGPGPVIGDFSIVLESVENAQVDVGWVLHPAYHGKGYATEGARALLDLIFGEIGVHRVRADLSPDNAASVALCLRLGMRHEAHFVDYEIFKGAWSDLDVYAILDREWRALRS